MPPPPQPPALMEDLIAEILLRLPPDGPASLIRATLVCRLWHGLVSDPGFLRCYCAFHRTPPVLGFLYNECSRWFAPRFVPTTRAPPISQPAPAGSPTCCTLDCRHGRVLLHAKEPSSNLTVWDPITADQQRFFPPAYHGYFTAAVLCALDGCDHLECSGGPFLVVFVATDFSSDSEDDNDDDGDGVVWASVYSSETGAWSELTSVYADSIIDIMPSLLAGDALYFILGFGENLLKYDLTRGVLSVVSSPPLDLLNMILVRAEDGGLGVAAVDGYSLQLWSWRTGPDGVGEWARGRVIELEAMVSIVIGDPSTKLDVVGFAEGADSVFVSATDGIFIVELKSGRVRKVGMSGDFKAVFPFMSFCTPASEMLLQ